MILTEKMLTYVVNGSAFLGSGGGGQIDTGCSFVSEIVKSNIPVELLTFPLSVDQKNMLCCIVCDIGSIGSIDQNQIGAIQTAFECLSSHFKDLGKIAAVFPIETGPENSLVPFVIAAKYGIPVVDGDGAGRAVPTLPLSSFSALGSISHWRPISIANGLGDSMLVNSHDVSVFDNVLRHIAGTEEFHNSASLALWPDKVGVLAKKCVPGSVSRSLALGKFLDGLLTKDISLINEALPTVNQLNGYLIGMGEVLPKYEEERSGFMFTTIRIANQIKGDIITVVAQNENLIAFSDSQYAPLAAAPDSICYLTTEFSALTNVEIKEGQVVFLIGILADKTLLHPDILSGFHKILRELGYVANINVKQRNVKKLGDLLLQLKSL